MSVQHITKENFEAMVEQSGKPVLVDFWATWCGPCKMLTPIVEEIASERDDIVVGKVNVDEEMELAIRFGITSIPALLLFKNGQVAATTIGYQSKEELTEFIG